MIFRVLALTLAVAFAGEARASRIAGAPTDFQDYLPSFDAVFIGYVDSVSVGRWTPMLPCGEGLSSIEAIRWVIRVDETLQGSGLHDREVVWGDLASRGFQSTAGSRVLAFGNRGCSHGWHLWGFALALDRDSVLTDCSYFDHSERLDVPHPRASLWRLLKPLRDRARGTTATVFDGFDGLGVFRATEALRGSNGRWEVAGRWVGSLKGSAPDDTVRLRFHPPLVWGGGVRTGDSLLVPWTGSAPAPLLTFDLRPDVFGIQHGIAKSFGRSLDALSAIIVRRDERYRIPPIVHP
jgi:hypothetical protein